MEKMLRQKLPHHCHRSTPRSSATHTWPCLIVHRNSIMRRHKKHQKTTSISPSHSIFQQEVYFTSSHMVFQTITIVIRGESKSFNQLQSVINTYCRAVEHFFQPSPARSVTCGSWAFDPGKGCARSAATARCSSWR